MQKMGKECKNRFCIIGIGIRPNIGLVNETFLLWVFES